MSFEYSEESKVLSSINLGEKTQKILSLAEEAPAGEEILKEVIYVAQILLQKNISYGNSALEPVRVFSKSSTEEQLLVRIDDKLSRLKRGSEFPGDDTIIDLIGYLVLLLVSRSKTHDSVF